MSRGTAKDQLEYEHLCMLHQRKHHEKEVLQWTLPDVIDYASREMHDMLRHLMKTYPDHLVDEEHAANVLQVAMDARINQRDKNMRYTAMRNQMCDRLEAESIALEAKSKKCLERVELGKRKKAERAQAKLAAEGITDPDAAVEDNAEQPAKRPTPIPALSLADLSTASVREQLLEVPPLALSPPQDDSVQEQLLA